MRRHGRRVNRFEVLLGVVSDIATLSVLEEDFLKLRVVKIDHLSTRSVVGHYWILNLGCIP